MTSAPPATDRRRSRLLLALTMTVGLGVITTLVPGHHSVTGAAGDALYAVMVWIVVALVAPRARGTVVTAGAVAVCWIIELAQATGVPAQIVHAVPPTHLLLGTTFAATDLLAYAVGGAAALATDSMVRRRRAGQRLSTPGMTPPASDLHSPRQS